jgi:hypothetical protein
MLNENTKIHLDFIIIIISFLHSHILIKLEINLNLAFIHNKGYDVNDNQIYTETQYLHIVLSIPELTAFIKHAFFIQYTIDVSNDI